MLTNISRRQFDLAELGGASWTIIKHDAGLQLPYQDNLFALIHERSFKQGRRGGVWSNMASLALGEPSDLGDRIKATSSA